MGRRLIPQALERRDPHRRHAILLTLLAQSAVDVLDEVVQLFDQAVSARESRANTRMTEALAERARGGEDRQALPDDLLAVLTDTDIADEEVGGLLRGDRVGWDRLRAATATSQPRLPRDHGHLAMLDASYGYLRQFTPQVLAAIDFAGGPTAAPLLEALEMLRGLNASGACKVPDTAPTGFVPTRWAGYLETATAAGDSSAYRHFWELCVLFGLRDGLRSGDVHVPGSRRHADPTAYLLTPTAWAAQRDEFCALVDKPADSAAALARAQRHLSGALDGLERTLATSATSDGEVRLGDDGELVIPPLSAEDIPAEADELRTELAAMLPITPIASLLVELDTQTGFLDCFTHAGGRQPRSPHLNRSLLAVLIAGRPTSVWSG